MSWIIKLQKPNVNLSLTRHNEGTIEVNKGACRSKNNAIFKTEKALRCSDFRGKTIQSVFPTTGQKNSVTRKFLQWTRWFANSICGERDRAESRGVSTSKERTGLICVKNQVNFWSLNDLLSLLFIRVQAQAQGNYTEGKRTSTSIDTSRTKRKHFNPFVFMLASNFFRGEISVVMLAFVLALLQKTRLNLLNEK